MAAYGMARNIESLELINQIEALNSHSSFTRSEPKRFQFMMNHRKCVSLFVFTHILVRKPVPTFRDVLYLFVFTRILIRKPVSTFRDALQIALAKD